MDSVRIVYEDEFYYPSMGSNFKMDILGDFLARDVGCVDYDFFCGWALADKADNKSKFTYSIGGNTTYLEEKEDGYIYMYDDTVSFDEMYQSEYLKMTRKQFVQLLDDWQEKVCKHKPKEVIIKYENDQFTIEAKY